MKVSVIVPVYGVEDYIIRCMDSLVNQTLKDIEIIVINDGTKDNSIKKICDKYDDDRIKIIYKANEGQAKARNRGVKYAKGKYLFFVDSDDFLELNTLEELYKVAESGHDLVCCDYYKYYDEEHKEAISLIEHYNPNNLKSIVTGMPGGPCHLILKKLYLDQKIEFLEGYIHEDTAIIPYLIAVSKNPTYIKKPFYYYFQREGSSLNRKEYNPKWEDIFYALEYLQKKFKDNNLYQEYHDELEYIYIEYLLHAPNLKFLDYKEGNKNIKRVSLVMKQEFPKWNKNKYYKEENIKYKIMCTLFYHNNIRILKLIRKVKAK